MTGARGLWEPAAKLRGERSVIWDAILSIALLCVSTLTAFLMAAVMAFAWARSELPDPVGRIAIVMVLILACGTSPRLVRNWPSARVHSQKALLAAVLVGWASVLLTALALGPWPELVSDEVVKGGPVVFYVELAKTFVPWAVGAFAGFVVLHRQSSKTTAQA